ncbi:MAG TPA: class III signal peptide-containing protein [Methanothermococcus okinawensis]|nr:class III signal peptide-containing protein [Methanothermococcus okinawensis]
MIIKTLIKKRGQLSLEFSILLLVILTLSIASIYHFMNNNLDKRDRDLDKIDIGAKTAISLVNSRYNGSNVEYPILYLGMSYDSDKTNISIYIKNQSPLDISTINLIERLIYDRADVDPSIYNITIVIVD